MPVTELPEAIAPPNAPPPDRRQQLESVLKSQPLPADAQQKLRDAFDTNSLSSTQIQGVLDSLPLDKPSKKTLWSAYYAPAPKAAPTVAAKPSTPVIPEPPSMFDRAKSFVSSTAKKAEDLTFGAADALASRAIGVPPPLPPLPGPAAVMARAPKGQQSPASLGRPGTLMAGVPTVPQILPKSDYTGPSPKVAGIHETKDAYNVVMEDGSETPLQLNDVKFFKEYPRLTNADVYGLRNPGLKLPAVPGGAQLADQRKAIEQTRQSLESSKSSLDQLGSQIDEVRKTIKDNPSHFSPKGAENVALRAKESALVDQYNSALAVHNQSVDKFKKDVDSYNSQVHTQGSAYPLAPDQKFQPINPEFDENGKRRPAAIWTQQSRGAKFPAVPLSITPPTFEEKNAFKYSDQPEAVTASYRAAIPEIINRAIANPLTAAARFVRDMTLGQIDPTTGTVSAPAAMFLGLPTTNNAIPNVTKILDDTGLAKDNEFVHPKQMSTWEATKAARDGDVQPLLTKATDAVVSFAAMSLPWEGIHSVLSTGLEKVLGPSTADVTTGILRRLEATLGTGAVFGAVSPKSDDETKTEQIANSMFTAAALHAIVEAITLPRTFAAQAAHDRLALFGQLIDDLAELIGKRNPDMPPQAATEAAAQAVNGEVKARGGWDAIKNRWIKESSARIKAESGRTVAEFVDENEGQPPAPEAITGEAPIPPIKVPSTPIPDVPVSPEIQETVAPGAPPQATVVRGDEITNQIPTDEQGVPVGGPQIPKPPSPRSQFTLGGKAVVGHSAGKIILEDGSTVDEASVKPTYLQTMKSYGYPELSAAEVQALKDKTKAPESETNQPPSVTPGPIDETKPVIPDHPHMATALAQTADLYMQDMADGLVGSGRRKSVIEFLQDQGGVQDPGGDVKYMEPIRKTGKRNLVRPPGKGGIPLDMARERLLEAGYPLPEQGSTENDVIDLIDSELRGNPVYSKHTDLNYLGVAGEVIHSLGANYSQALKALQQKSGPLYDRIRAATIDWIREHEGEQIQKFLDREGSDEPAWLTEHDEPLDLESSNPLEFKEGQSSSDLVQNEKDLAAKQKELEARGIAGKTMGEGTPGKVFDETGLVESPLFGGQGGPQGDLGLNTPPEPIEAPKPVIKNKESLERNKHADPLVVSKFKADIQSRFDSNAKSDSSRYTYHLGNFVAAYMSTPSVIEPEIDRALGSYNIATSLDPKVIAAVKDLVKKLWTDAAASVQESSAKKPEIPQVPPLASQPKTDDVEEFYSDPDFVAWRDYRNSLIQKYGRQEVFDADSNRKKTKLKPEELSKLDELYAKKKIVEARFQEKKLPAVPETPATAPRYSVQANPDGTFGILQPNGKPSVKKPFATEAQAQAAVDKLQAKFQEMTGATSKSAAPPEPVKSPKAIVAPKQLPAVPADIIKQAAAAKPTDAELQSLDDDLATGPKTLDDLISESTRAYHGSPHDFREFSLQHIGTGEGNQSYGWGLYFAGNKEIADYYREVLSKQRETSNLVFKKDGKTLSGYDPLVEEFFKVGSFVPSWGGSLDKVIAFHPSTGTHHWSVRVIETDKHGLPAPGEHERSHATYPSAKELHEVLTKRGWTDANSGKLYTVDIPDNDEYLEWGKPLSKQSDKVKKALESAGIEVGTIKYPTLKQALALFNSSAVEKLAHSDIGIRQSLKEGYQYAKDGEEAAFKSWFDGHGDLISPTRNKDVMGWRAYEQLGHDLRNKQTDRQSQMAPQHWQELASKELAKHGIAGIRYSDASSRHNLRILPPTKSIHRKWTVGELGNGVDKLFDTEKEARDYFDQEEAKKTYNYVVFDDKLIKMADLESTISDMRTDVKRSGIEPLIERAQKLAKKIDRMYKDGEDPSDLEAELDPIVQLISEHESDYEQEHLEEEHGSEAPASVEQLLAKNYMDLLALETGAHRYTSLRDRESILENLKGNIELFHPGSKTPTDEEAIAAAKDAYETIRDRRERIKSVSNPDEVQRVKDWLTKVKSNKGFISHMATDSLTPENARMAREFLDRAPLTGKSEYKVIDTNYRLPVEFVKELAQSEALGKLADVVGEQFNVIHKVVSTIRQADPNDKFAISLSAGHIGGNMEGFRLGLSHNTIMIQPYTTISEIESEKGFIESRTGKPVNVARRTASRIVYTIVHELSHDQFRDHDAKHTGLTGRLSDFLHDDLTPSIDAIQHILEADGLRVYNQLASDGKRLEGLRSGAIPGRPGTSASIASGGLGSSIDTANGQGEGTGSRGALQNRSGLPTSDMATGAGPEPSDASVTDLDDETLTKLLKRGTYQYKQTPDWPEWSAAMGKIGDWLQPYLPTAYELIDNVMSFSAPSESPAPQAQEPTATSIPSEPVRGPPQKGALPDVPTTGITASESGNADAGQPAEVNGETATVGEPGEGAGRPGEPSVAGAPAVSGTETRPVRDGGTGKRGTGAITRGGIDNSGFYRITDADALGAGGPVAKFKRNLAAIKVLKSLQAENRLPTPEERKTMAGYVGWGSLSEKAFSRHDRETGDLANQLQDLLTPEEFAAARKSTENAHYTSAETVKFMWDLATRLGFKGNGTILEPSMGTGNFFGLAPDSAVQRGNFIGAELDPITGNIAKYLYPGAQIRVAGYETLVIPDNSVDLAISNVPFGEKVYDPQYKHLNARIHDYFFVKSLDKIRPGGLIMFITSKGTMDKPTERIRELMADKADMVAAYRLPNTAFAKNAGTEVTTDIIILQKRQPSALRGGPNFLSVKEISPGLSINEYYADHPENMFGKMTLGGTMYRGGESTLEATEPLDQMMAQALAKAPKGIMKGVRAQAGTGPSIIDQLAPDNVKDLAYTINDKGQLVQRINGVLTKPRNPAVLPRQTQVKFLIELREQLKKVIATQMMTSDDVPLKVEQDLLNTIYDKYVKHYGILHDKRTDIFSEDPQYTLLLALEDYNTVDKTGSKSAIFSKRTIHPIAPLDVVSEKAGEALLQVLGERGFPDIPFLAQLSGKSEADVTAELEKENLVFQNPGTGNYEMAPIYLSGYTREKLGIAKKAAAADPKFQRNVEALTNALPPFIPIGRIFPVLGQPWIPEQAIKSFIREVINGGSGNRVDIVKLPDATWKVKFDSPGDANMKWGSYTETAGGGKIQDFTPAQLLDKAMNMRQPVVRRKDADGNEYTDKQATLNAREKINEIQEAFGGSDAINGKRSVEGWARTNPQWAPAIEERFNNEFNGITNLKYNGSHLTFPGMDIGMKLHPHQADAAWRSIVNGQALLAHAVGTGKTYTMIAAGMELRRLGISKKNMYAVPNGKVSQWLGEFHKLYPAANVLAIGREDLGGDRRRQTISRIATGDWDAVIIQHSSFGLIPISPERMKKTINAEIEELNETIKASSQNMGASELKRDPTVKALEKMKTRLQEKLKKLADMKHDNTIHFDELGVDYLFIDELHEFKSLQYYTKMGNISGLSQSAAKKGLDLKSKTDFIQEKNRGRGVIGATGTPISNSMAEMYNMMRYIAPDVLKEAGVTHFDQWASTFGKVINVMELSPDGQTFRARQKFAKFINVQPLLQMFRSFTDVKHKYELKLPEPRVKGGGPQPVTISSNEIMEPIFASFLKRAEALRANPQAMKQKGADNWLTLTMDGKKVALDLRLYDADLPDHPLSKSNVATQGIFDRWKDGASYKSTQIVFADLYQDKTQKFNLFTDMKKKLVKMGVPEKEIALAVDYDSDEQIARMQQQMNNGDIRILFGTTAKIGVGINVQKKLQALHDLDAPWRPDQLEQRHGRIIRQGNEHYDMDKEVEILQYVTKRSFDAYIFQALETKAQFIGTAMSGDFTGDEMDDAAGAVVMNFAALKGIASDNPDVQLKIRLESEITVLNMKLRNYNADENVRESSIRQREGMIASIHQQSAHLVKARDEYAAYMEAHPAPETKKKLTAEEQAALPKFTVGSTGVVFVVYSPDNKMVERDGKTVYFDEEKQAQAFADAHTAELHGGSDWAADEQTFDAIIGGQDFKSKADLIAYVNDNREKVFQTGALATLYGVPLKFEAVYTKEKAVAGDKLTFGEVDAMVEKIKHRYQLAGTWEDVPDTIPGFLQSVKFRLGRLAGTIKLKEESVVENQRVIEGIREQMNKPFRYAEELATAKEKLAEVTARTIAKDKAENPKEEEIIDDEGEDMDEGQPLPSTPAPKPEAPPTPVQSPQDLAKGLMSSRSFILPETPKETPSETPDQIPGPKDRSGERGGIPFMHVTPPPPIPPAVVPSPDSQIERLFRQPDGSKTVWEKLKAIPEDVYKFMSSGSYISGIELQDVKDFPVFMEKVRRAQENVVDGARKTQKKLEEVLDGLHPVEMDVFRRIINQQDMYETASTLGEDRIPLEGVDQLSRIKAEIDRLEGIATPAVMAAVDRHHAWMKEMWDEFVQRGIVSASDGRYTYFPNMLLHVDSQLDPIPGLPMKMQNLKNQNLKERKGHITPHDPDYIRVMDKYGTRSYTYLNNFDFLQAAAEENDILSHMDDADKKAILATTKGELRPGAVYHDGAGNTFKAFQPNTGRIAYPAQVIENQVLWAAIDAGLDELAIDLQAYQQNLPVPELPTTMGEPLTRSAFVLGGNRKTYLLPAAIANKLEHFKENQRIGPFASVLRAAMQAWKISAITFSGLHYHINNFIGDDISLYVEDMAALGDQPAALKLIRGKLNTADAEELTRMIEDARVWNSTFIAGGAMGGAINSPSLRKYRKNDLTGSLNPFGSNPLGDALREYQRLGQIRESIPKVAKFIADFRRVRQGLPVVTKGISLAGLDPLSDLAVGRASREMNGDFGKISGRQRLFYNLAFQFLPYHVLTMGQWARRAGYKAKGMPPGLYFVLAAGAIYGTAFAWNNYMYPEVEANLEDWQREMLHINTGAKDAEGMPVTVSIETPIDMAARWVGLHTLQPNIEKVMEGKMTIEQAAAKQVHDIFGFQEHSVLPTAAGAQLEELFNPMAKVLMDLRANKDSRTGRQIVPDNLMGGTGNVWPKTITGQKMFGEYVVKKMVSPYMQMLRAAQSDSADSDISTWFNETGPFSWKRALGITSVNPGAQESKDYLANVNLQKALHDEKLLAISNIYLEFAGGNITAAQRDALIQPWMDRPGLNPTGPPPMDNPIPAEQSDMDKIQLRPSFMLQMDEMLLRKTTDPEKRKAIALEMAGIREKMGLESYFGLNDRFKLEPDKTKGGRPYIEQPPAPFYPGKPLLPPVPGRAGPTLPAVPGQ